MLSSSSIVVVVVAAHLLQLDHPSLSSSHLQLERSQPAPTKKTKGAKGNKDVELVDLVEKSCKEKHLLEHLKSKTVSRKHKESLCLVWFVQSVLWAKDTNLNKSLGLFKLAEAREAFNNYLWGFESYRLTIDYLLRELKSTLQLVPTVGELMMSFLTSFVPLEFEPDILIDRFKVELAGVISITRKSSGANGIDGAAGIDDDGVVGGISNGNDVGDDNHA
ncbi:hypothetical protein RND71_001591 [Anisodus tanguticus]|uniref:DUF1985 domain-containing protein n=1 Tax=Anisodus tanguticus TaxID=243964 RepID=A0AAE1T174_9SOLA|nr:hypothetical protein RND71_001591 [Anisodus tanguticus]